MRTTNAGDTQAKNKLSQQKRLARQRDFFCRMDAGALTALLAQLNDVSFFMKDAQGRFIALNRRGCDYCGVANEIDAIGCTDRDFFPKARADEYMRDDQAVMKSGQAILHRVESAPEQLGSPRLVVTHKVPVHDSQGKVIGVAGISLAAEELSVERQQLAKLEQVIAELHDDPAAAHTAESMAATAGLSVSQFERTFRKAFGTTPRQQLMRLRVENACRLLRNGDDSIANIAVSCGFFDHAHFTRTFRRFMGMTPADYRNA